MMLPPQKLPTTEKFKADKASGLNAIEKTAKYYLEQITFNRDREEILSLYKLLDDSIDTKEYDYVLNPFNTKIEKYTKFRGRIRNFNIITPVIEMFLSEFGRRNHNPQVIQTNPNDATEKEKALNKFYFMYLRQKSINALNEAGMATGEESKELKPLEEATKEFENAYVEDRLIDGQTALDYIRYNEDIDDKHINLYEDYLVCGRAISYKGVHSDDVKYDEVSPLEYYFPFSVNEPRLEDRDWGIRKWGMTPYQLLDFHNGYLSDELVKKINETNTDSYSINSLNYSDGQLYMSDDNFNRAYRHLYREDDNSLNHYHIVFKSFKRVATLTYYNELGEVKEMEVEDTYKKDKSKGDISLSYYYRNAVYETFFIEFNGIEEFVRTQEIPYDRADVNNKSNVKLPYNGIAITTKSGEIKSVVKTGRNYQTIYNILKYNQETMINKNKDKIAVIPLGLMNKGKNGWDEEKSMYYAEANSTLFIDETAPNAALALQGIKVLDMSLSKYINDINNLAEAVKNDWWDSVGMNRQRYGDTKASDGKATTEQAIFRSSLISENMLRKFEKYQETDYAGLLDVSKFAWINGIKGQYINTEGRQAFLELNADDAIYHTESSYDVFVRFSGEENEKILKAQDYLFNATQNGFSISGALESLDNTSFAKMKKVIRLQEEEQQAYEEQQAQLERESKEAIANSKMETEKAKRDTEVYKADKEYDKAINVEMLKQQGDEKGELDNILETYEARRKQKETDLKEIETLSKVKKEDAETSKIKKETNIMTNNVNNKTS